MRTPTARPASQTRKDEGQNTKERKGREEGREGEQTLFERKTRPLLWLFEALGLLDGLHLDDLSRSACFAHPSTTSNHNTNKMKPKTF